MSGAATSTARVYAACPSGCYSDLVATGRGLGPSPEFGGETQVGKLSNEAGPNDEVIRLVLDEQKQTRRVGHYEVTGTLGRGGMGVVYEVVDTRSGSSFALKTI